MDLTHEHSIIRALMKESYTPEQPACTPMIQLIDASLGYANERTATLAHLNLTVCSGEMVAVIGPNGAGKSTLLKTIVGLIPPYAGKVIVHGAENNNPHRGCISYVPQREAIDWQYPITVSEVVMMGRYGQIPFFGRPSERDRQIVADAMKRMGIESFADRRISDLSGGQQQRIFLARALAQQPHILLMDEPFNAVDLTTEKVILESLHDFHAHGVTSLVVTHDLALVRENFDKVLLLNDQELEFGTVEEIMHPDKLAKIYGRRGLLI